MQLSGLLELLRQHPAYQEMLRRLRAGDQVEDLGVLRAARPYVLAALARDWNAPVVYITARVDRAYNISEQLFAWLGSDACVCRFGEPTPLFYERAPWGETIIRSRLETLAALMPPEGDDSGGQNTPIVVTSARALMQRTLPVNQFRKAAMVLQTGQKWRIDQLLERWLRLGYEGASMVIEPGTFSRRGGILDIFPLVADRPIRISFSFDEIESLRTFDPSTQRSIDKLDRVVILPGHEALPESMPPVAAHLAPWFQQHAHPEADMTSPQADQQPLADAMGFAFAEFYLPYLYTNPVSLLDYAPDNALIILDDGSEVQATIENIDEASRKTRAEKLETNLIPPDYPQPYLDWSSLSEALRGRFVLRMGSATMEGVDDEGAIMAHEVLRGLFSPEDRFGGKIKEMLPHLRELRNKRDSAVVVSLQTARLVELWQQETAFAPRADLIMEPPEPSSVVFVEGALREGWRLRTGAGEFHLFSDAEIFGWKRPEPRRRKTPRRARAPEAAYADLRQGDFVVHMDYGVGRFAGIRRRTLNGLEREYLMIEYAGTDTVFVPIHQADRLTRYVGPDDKPPSLSKLGQADWIRIKSKAKQAVEEEARELLALYALRASAPGHAYQPDSPWQHELEASFPYVETEDQLKAVRDVKQDMEKPHPMDRLICGDVGFGKTEVAVRAAFKAVMDGKQVAVLVPTTILAQQHYETFRQRMASFPVKVETLSRFRTKQEQNETLRKLALGEVDIVIGTHRLLSDDVTLKNIGLVIIDEEQRFGVKHKEHFKGLRSQVDVLTLTATPIPRTLYMGLSGVRDISMIQTPPEERLPVITHVGPFDERLVRQSILREMERGGQVYFVHNRVNSIDSLQEHLEEIVPEARVVVGHGQMDERLLESVMTAFGNGDYDVLLATSIIESGLDIPAANTLIVDRADWFGLAQMYQLRGRVGRSAQQAYAYFFHPGGSKLTEEAHARMETLTEYTELGSGYQIAMRDLELRGAGDILSMRQTGHVAAIGLHLYTQMLAGAVRDLKGGAVVPEAAIVSENSVMIDLPLPAYLPNDYVPDISQRLHIYRRIGGLLKRDEVKAMSDELQDRFGPLPPAVDGLLYQIEIKILAQRVNATAVLGRDGEIEVRLPYLVEVDRNHLQRDLGADVKITRTAVVLQQRDEWDKRLIEVLLRLDAGLRVMAGV